MHAIDNTGHSLLENENLRKKPKTKNWWTGRPVWVLVHDFVFLCFICRVSVGRVAVDREVIM